MDEERYTAQGISDTKIAGAIIGRVTTDDNQGFNRTSINLTDETCKLIDLLGRTRLDRLSIDDGATNIPKFSIDGMDQGMDRSRLLITGDNKTPATVGFEIFEEMGEESVCGFW